MGQANVGDSRIGTTTIRHRSLSPVVQFFCDYVPGDIVRSIGEFCPPLRRRQLRLVCREWDFVMLELGLLPADGKVPLSLRLQLVANEENENDEEELCSKERLLRIAFHGSGSSGRLQQHGEKLLYDMACSGSCPVIVSSLLKFVKPSDESFKIASCKGHVKIVRVLLESGLDLSHCFDFALLKASLYGHVEVVRLLLASGANVHENSDAALRMSSRRGHLDVVRVLLESGDADVHAMNEYSLRHAARFGHLEVVRLLLEAGADQTAERRQALDWAEEYHRKHSEVDSNGTELVALLSRKPLRELPN